MKLIHFYGCLHTTQERWPWTREELLRNLIHAQQQQKRNAEWCWTKLDIKAHKKVLLPSFTVCGGRGDDTDE